MWYFSTVKGAYLNKDNFAEVYAVCLRVVIKDICILSFLQVYLYFEGSLLLYHESFWLSMWKEVCSQNNMAYPYFHNQSVCSVHVKYTIFLWQWKYSRLLYNSKAVHMWEIHHDTSRDCRNLSPPLQYYGWTLCVQSINDVNAIICQRMIIAHNKISNG